MAKLDNEERWGCSVILIIIIFILGAWLGNSLYQPYKELKEKEESAYIEEYRGYQKNAVAPSSDDERCSDVRVGDLVVDKLTKDTVIVVTKYINSDIRVRDKNKDRMLMECNTWESL